MIIIVWVNDVNDGKDQNRKKEETKVRQAMETNRKKMAMAAMNRFIKYTIFLPIAIVYYSHSFKPWPRLPRLRSNEETTANEMEG